MISISVTSILSFVSLAFCPSNLDFENSLSGKRCWLQLIEPGEQRRDRRCTVGLERNGRPDLAICDRVDSTDCERQIRVLFDTYVPVPPETRAIAQKRTSIIFQQTGVQIIWATRLGAERESLESPGSSEGLQTTEYILRILPRARSALTGSALGEALLCQPGEAACFANVFYDRVRQRTDLERISLGEVLGHTMAHELGHLLLGSNSHARCGIMQAKWSAEDMKHAARGDLQFTPEQAATIRDHVLTRIRVPSASSP